ncbi:hypothetical protein [Endozoicomonas atrinae]|uniref:DUF7210 family protein n=1 Tax=Endozoicomonas atrinae TaxID=1333660 RepID=UPI000825D253|nr:hypothetical protein [Endozoicomonas atrinae]
MKYTALHSVRHDGQLYQAGETLELDDTAADTLLDCRAVAAMEAAEAEVTEPAKPAPKQKSKGKK